MQWIEVTVRTASAGIELLCAKLTDAGFDSFVVILESDGKQQMLYKHAISTIVPIAVIDLKGAEESEE